MTADPIEEEVAPALPTTRRAQLTTGLAVAAGAALGAVTRFLLGAGIDTAFGMQTSALSTTVINLLGCVFFGIVSTIDFANPRLAAMSGTGFCGGFTAFSAFVIALIAQSTTSIAAIASVLVIHIVGCPVAYWIGTKCVREKVE
ncbi:MAG: CrcB family protein [Corynebacterium sp.]|uniref:fluoride efflux transporter FluC n=1 Tax=Corynebacterium sp. TaxID=1720 RepID=UPI0026DB82CE|nr:CrcB family protein [Corynebacterium sp.]MDO5030755.1 CrcB family protein [Corynebacterium sp.]